MDASDIPSRFNIPFANGAGGSYIRTVPEAPSATPGAASLTDGFPPLNFLSRGAGGVPPFGQDMNGILNQITQWAQWQAAGNPIFFDAAFAAAVGGYPAGAMLSSTTPGIIWVNLVDGNATNPDSGGANWQSISTFTPGFGQCRLSVTSATVLKLAPYNGQLLTINGAAQSIPGAGITLANTGLTANTLYYVYAYMNVSIMTLEASATGYTVASNGIPTKTGDTSRTLVGMIYTSNNTPGQFVDSSTQRFCANWFNRRPVSAQNGGGGSLGSGSATTDVTPSNHAQCLAWAGEVHAGCNGNLTSPNLGGLVDMGVGIDGVVSQSQTGINVYVAGYIINFAVTDFTPTVADGLHYSTGLGSTDSGVTAAFTSFRTTLTAFI